MAGPFVLKNASVTFNGVDLSDHVVEVSLPAEVQALDTTTMGSNTTHSIPGLKGSKITVTFQQDFTAGKTDATLWAAYAAGTVAPLVIKPDAGAVGPTNPSYTAQCYVQSYPILSGKVGTVPTCQVVFEISTGDLVRATS